MKGGEMKHEMTLKRDPIEMFCSNHNPLSSGLM